MSTETSSPDRLELPVQGMTCASCANRIERKLNKLDGVSATVNYATEKAAVEFDAAKASTDDLIGAVAAAGYLATVPSSPGGAAAGEEPGAGEDRHVVSPVSYTHLTLPTNREV